MKKVIVSLFDNYRTKEPKAIELWDWLLTPRFKDVVEKIRSVESKEDRDRLKGMLPCITPSGRFRQRKASELIEHSGYICIDIDAKDNPQITDFAALRDELANILNIAYCALSVSGKGVFSLIPIAHPDKHKEHFEALKVAFEQFNITIDKGCGDVSRLRGCTYDAHAYVNQDAVVFNHTIDYRDVSKKQSLAIPKNTRKPEGNKDTKGKVMEVISRIEETGTDITETYEQWFQVGCALANEFGEEGREFFHAVSRFNPGYKSMQTDGIFSSCQNERYAFNIGTFFYLAKKYGLTE